MCLWAWCAECRKIVSFPREEAMYSTPQGPEESNVESKERSEIVRRNSTDTCIQAVISRPETWKGLLDIRTYSH